MNSVIPAMVHPAEPNKFEKRKNPQNSLRRARPLKLAYSFRHFTKYPHNESTEFAKLASVLPLVFELPVAIPHFVHTTASGRVSAPQW